MNVNPMSVDKQKEFRRRIKAHQKSRVAAFFVLPPLFEQEDEKLNDKLNAEASSATQEHESQYNALKHGGYSEELILPGENLEEFEVLHKDLKEEWNPIGASEQDAVLTLAFCHWQKRRVNRWYNDEVAWLSEHPGLDQIQSLEWYLHLLDRAKTIRLAHDIIRKLPEHYLQYMSPELDKPYTDEKKEIQRLRDWLLVCIGVDEYRLDFEKDTLIFKAETGVLLRELTEKKLAIEARLDSQIDKAIKRLAQIKTLKQVIQVQAFPAKTENHRRGLPPPTAEVTDEAA
jgi:hypothetical protein